MFFQPFYLPREALSTILEKKSCRVLAAGLLRVAFLVLTFVVFVLGFLFCRPAVVLVTRRRHRR